MYRSWKDLIIDSDEQLRDPIRVRRVLRAQGHVGLGFVILFIAMGVASITVVLALLHWIINTPNHGFVEYFWTAFMIAMTAAFFFAAKIVYQERDLNPIRGYLLDPGKFEFTQGRLTSVTFCSNKNRMNQKMLAKGIAKASDGEHLEFFEDFSPDVWPFMGKNDDKHLNADDDMFELKGKRRPLPVSVYVIYSKDKPRSVALIAIDRALIPTVPLK